MIRIDHVSKRFGGRMAVEDLSIDVPRGAVYGLLGHNGAGKSTTLGMLLGQVFPDAGHVSIDGEDVFKNRKKALGCVGAIFESPVFFDYLSGWRNLKILCDYSGPVEQARLDEVIELVGLTDRIGDKVGKYSHGMRQRLALAQALLPGPTVLILDEPADGLDPEGIAEMRGMIARLNQEWALTILFSSHQLNEVEAVCSHVAVMRQGKLVFNGKWPPEGESGTWISIATDRDEEARSGLLSAGLAAEATADGRIRLSDEARPAEITKWLVENGFAVSEVGPVKRTLEEFYMELSGGAVIGGGEVISSGDAEAVGIGGAAS